MENEGTLEGEDSGGKGLDYELCKVLQPRVPAISK